MIMTQATGHLTPCQKMVHSLKTMELASMMITATVVPGCKHSTRKRFQKTNKSQSEINNSIESGNICMQMDVIATFNVVMFVTV
jgi:hypothetical protein